MKVALLKESRSQEKRVALTPEVVKKIISLGHQVVVQKGAGASASFLDEAYEQAGASLKDDPKAVCQDAQILVKVHGPEQKEKDSYPELSCLSQGAIVVGLLNPHENPGLLDACNKYGLTAMALELIPRISRAQSMDVLSSQSNLAGYRAVIEASHTFDRAFPMMMTAAGTIPPARVLVLGAGVAGLQAIATARRLGAIVSAFDVRSAAKEQVESLGASFISVEGDQPMEDGKGYAKDTSDAYKKQQEEKISDALKVHDIVISTALIPGKPAPLLVKKEMIAGMKTGSVLVDLAISQGGNIEGSQADIPVRCHGSTLLAPSIMAAHIARDASQLYARNILNFLQLIWGKQGGLDLDWEDPIIQGATLTHKGATVHELFSKKT